MFFFKTTTFWVAYGPINWTTLDYCVPQEKWALANVAPLSHVKFWYVVQGSDIFKMIYR